MKVDIGSFNKMGKQKINVRLDSWDFWSFDYTLANIILPGLLSLRENSTGIPAEFSTVGGEPWHDQLSFQFYADSCPAAFDVRLTEWEGILNKMIWSFSEIVCDESKFFSTNGHPLNPQPNTNWYDHAGYIEYERRIQEGIDLFGKYFRNLWI